MTKSSPIAPKRRKLKPKRFTRKSVIKMLTVMSQPDESGSDPVKDFLTTGRVGRRNALPDIMGEHAHVTTSDLPDKMNQLSTSDCNFDQSTENGASHSGSTFSKKDGPSTSNRS